MSHENMRSEINFTFLRPGVIHGESALITLPEESNDIDIPILADQVTDANNSIEECVGTDVTLEDLFNSPEFLEEQRMILLTFEVARSRTEDKQKTPPPRSRRTSIGLKLTCPVCLESLSSVNFKEPKMVTECGHVFCQACIEDVCEKKKEQALCPVCRKNVGQLRKVFI